MILTHRLRMNVEQELNHGTDDCDQSGMHNQILVGVLAANLENSWMDVDL